MMSMDPEQGATPSRFAITEHRRPSRAVVASQT